MKKVTFNNNHNADNVSYGAGEVKEISQGLYDALKGLDIFGQALQAGSEQTPLITDASEA